MFLKLTASLLLIFLTTGTAFAQIEIRVDLISKDGFDSSNRVGSEQIENSDVLLTVINKTKGPIEIPRGYWPAKIRLCSSSSFGTLHPLVLGWRDGTRHDRTLMDLPAGKEHQILRVDSATVLLNPGDQYSPDPKAEFTKPRWVWNWSPRSGPDYSPFETRKGDKRTVRAVLWAEIDLDGQTIRSVPILVTREKDAG